MGIQYSHLAYLESINCVLSYTMDIPLIPFLLKHRVPQNLRNIFIFPGTLSAAAVGVVLPADSGRGTPETADLGLLDIFFAGHFFSGVERIVIEFEIGINPNIEDKSGFVDEYRDSKIGELRLLRETGQLDFRVEIVRSIDCRMS